MSTLPTPTPVTPRPWIVHDPFSSWMITIVAVLPSSLLVPWTRSGPAHQAHSHSRGSPDHPGLCVPPQRRAHTRRAITGFLVTVRAAGHRRTTDRHRRTRVAL
jgi:hypothetical protein